MLKVTYGAALVAESVYFTPFYIAIITIVMLWLYGTLYGALHGIITY